MVAHRIHYSTALKSAYLFYFCLLQNYPPLTYDKNVKKLEFKSL